MRKIAHHHQFLPTQACQLDKILKKVSSRPNINEGVLIAHIAVQNKIRITIWMPRSILHIQKWSDLMLLSKVCPTPLLRTI